MNNNDEDLVALGIIKDRRRRLICIIPNTNTGYQVSDKDLKFIQMYKSRYLLISMVFVLLFTFGTFNPVLLIGVSILFYIASYFLYNFWFIKRFNIIKVREEDLAKLSTPAAKKIERNNFMLEVVVSLAVLYILVSPLFIPKEGVVLTTFEVYAIYTATTIVTGYALYNLYRYIQLFIQYKKDSK